MLAQMESASLFPTFDANFGEIQPHIKYTTYALRCIPLSVLSQNNSR